MNNSAPIAVLGCMSLLLSVASVMAADLNVDNTNPACDDTGGIPFCTISAALEQAQPGDIITVAGSTYFEAIRIDKDNLTVRGADHPTIDGSGVLFPGVSIDASGVRFKGFEVVHGMIGINIGGSQNKVKRNWVHDAFTGIHVGVGFDSSETFHVVTHNRVYNIKGSGIEVVSSKNTIRRNLSRKNIGGVEIIVTLFSNDNILTNNRASKNTFGGFGIGGSRNKVINNVAKKTVAMDLVLGEDKTTNSLATQQTKINSTGSPIRRLAMALRRQLISILITVLPGF